MQRWAWPRGAWPRQDRAKVNMGSLIGVAKQRMGVVMGELGVAEMWAWLSEWAGLTLHRWAQWWGRRWAPMSCP